MLIDIHAHLDYEPFDKTIDEVIKRSKNNGVKIIIANGTNPKANRKVLELSKKYDIIKPALGYYPTEAEEISDKEFDKELKFIKKNKPIALGEIGLEFKYGKDKEKQIRILKKFIILGQELDIPLIVHTRGAEEEILEILKNQSKVVLHCFQGNKKLIQKAIEYKFNFSIPANIIKLQHFQMLVKMVPLKSLLTETDAPFLSPYPNKINEPSNVQLTVNKIAEIKSLDPKEVEKMIFMNYQRLF